ncbi:Fic family protein [Streptomyces sp. NPDC059909]|uniref:Fic family protein n=1 Tax=Streptomyces sp. NPDC059909 TaxID=3346998 RepID=UPI003656A832
MRTYEQTHPWITFNLNLERDLNEKCWLLLGESISKLDHIAGVPLQPDIAAELNTIFLSKGAHATTQIEGNTLSEEQVRRRVDHDLDLPPSQEYLGQEIDNVVAGYNRITSDLTQGDLTDLTPERIRMFNTYVLKDLLREGDGKPGEIRTTSVTVGNVYRGAPAEDCAYLLDKLCGWLAELRDVSVGTAYERPVAILSALMAHLYITWIHPFEDGNGRTARLVEYQLLLQAGAPAVAAHVIADHYNKTRTAYYRELHRTSREPYSPTGLVEYSLQGFVDGLRQQLVLIQEQQLTVTWHHFVHDVYGKDTPASSRQRKLLLALPYESWTPKGDIRTLLGTRIALLYADKDDKTITRDVNALEQAGLLMTSRRGVITIMKPRIDRLLAFTSPSGRPPIGNQP